MKDGLVQQTEWSGPKEVIDTEYGAVSVQTWLDREKDRISNGYGRVAEIRGMNNGKVALFVNDVGDHDRGVRWRMKNRLAKKEAKQKQGGMYEQR